MRPGSLALLLAVAAPARSCLVATGHAKEIQADVATSQRLTLRVDGLACYFCAYGLERAFRRSGLVSAFDIDMEAGLVFVELAAGQPAPSFEDLRRIVHQAGYTPRDEVSAELRGRVVEEGGQRYLELVQATGRIALGPSDALDAWAARGARGGLVLVKGPVSADRLTPFRVTPTSVEPAE